MDLWSKNTIIREHLKQGEFWNGYWCLSYETSFTTSEIIHQNPFGATSSHTPTHQLVCLWRRIIKSPKRQQCELSEGCDGFGEEWVLTATVGRSFTFVFLVGIGSMTGCIAREKMISTLNYYTFFDFPGHFFQIAENGLRSF